MWYYFIASSRLFAGIIYIYNILNSDYRNAGTDSTLLRFLAISWSKSCLGLFCSPQVPSNHRRIPFRADYCSRILTVIDHAQIRTFRYLNSLFYRYRSCHQHFSLRFPVFRCRHFFLSSIKDGMNQTGFKGWPLYHYSKDMMPGDVKGQGFKGIWSIVDPMNFPPK
jgi:hypothetical protein